VGKFFDCNFKNSFLDLLPSVPSTISPRYVSFKSSAILSSPSSYNICWCYENLPACLLPYCFRAQRSAKTSHSIRPRQMYARGDAGIVFPIWSLFAKAVSIHQILTCLNIIDRLYATTNVW